MLDSSKVLMFVGLILTAVLLVTNHKRPSASTPLDGDETVGESQTENDQRMISPTWAANVPTLNPPPLSLMMPTTGAAPTVDT